MSYDQHEYTMHVNITVPCMLHASTLMLHEYDMHVAITVTRISYKHLWYRHVRSMSVTVMRMHVKCV